MRTHFERQRLGRDNMSNVCFECDSDMIQVRRTEPVTVRGEKIEVEFEYLQCPNCGEEYEVSRPDNDPLDRAYRIYRERKGLLQPEDIRGFREDLQLSQREMSAILGIGVGEGDYALVKAKVKIKTTGRSAYGKNQMMQSGNRICDTDQHGA